MNRMSGGQWLHGQEKNFLYEFVDGRFDFGDSHFDSVEHYWHLSNGQFANQGQCTNLSTLARHILTESFDIMANYSGSLGDFYVQKFMQGLRRKEFFDVPFGMAMQMEIFHHTRINNYFASLDWYDVSARLLATKPHTGGSQWVTWRDEGFRTMFDFISVRFAAIIFVF